jgi:hypothetical protein
LEVIQEAVRKCRLDPKATGFSFQETLGEAVWAAQTVGESRDASTHPKEKEATCRLALGFWKERRTVASSEELNDSALQSGATRRGLGNLFLDQNRIPEAREKAEQLERELKQAEATPDARSGDLTKVRGMLKELRSRLPAE